MKLDDALGIHVKALQLRARRSEILAANLANADTPGYKARDFDFKAVLRDELPVAGMAVTHGSHIRDEEGPVGSSRMRYRVPMQPSLDGNSVDTQLEYSSFATNALGYQTTLRFLNGKIQSLLLAIKGQ